jgi:hypothetical protein
VVVVATSRQVMVPGSGNDDNHPALPTDHQNSFEVGNGRRHGHFEDDNDFTPTW